MYCSQCGHKNSDDAKFCTGCGAALGAVSAATGDRQPDPADGNSREAYYRAAIGSKNTEYYLERFRRFDAEGTGMSWNWPAFFITFYWLLYRKMWTAAIVYFFLPLPLSILETLMAPGSPVVVAAYGIYFIAVFIAAPLWANAYYYRHVNNRIDDLLLPGANPDTNIGVIAAKGGTSSAAIIVAFVFVFIFVAAILAAIAIPAYNAYVKEASLTMVREGVEAAGSYQAKVEDYAMANRAWPDSLADVRMEDIPKAGRGSVIDISNRGVVVVTYHIGEKEMSLAFSPSVNSDGYIVWQCQAIDFAPDLIPDQCE